MAESRLLKRSSVHDGYCPICGAAGCKGSCASYIKQAATKVANPAQFDTPAFKSWFNGSKIVDKDGNPLRCFHGTTAEFDKFDIPENKVAYFTPDTSYGHVWRGPNVLPVYLSIKNPYFTEYQQDVEGAGYWPEWIEELKGQGYDGIVYAKKEDLSRGPLGWADDKAQIVAFYANQIKSATGNTGEFNPADDRITASMPVRAHSTKAGAGCVFIAKDTRRILLALRSDEVNESGTWAVWGGGMEEGETPEQTARREAQEEAGYNGPADFEQVYVHKDGEFVYTIFVAWVPKEFTPVLNWENSDFEWCDAANWPAPLHYGLVETMSILQRKQGKLAKATKRGTLQQDQSQQFFTYLKGQGIRFRVSESGSRTCYVYTNLPDRKEFKARFSDHGEPPYKDPRLEQARKATISVDPSTGKTVEDVIALYEEMAGLVVKQGSKTAAPLKLDLSWVEKLRKDFLTLMKNLPNVSNFDQANTLREGYNTYRKSFEDIFFERFLNKELKYSGMAKDRVEMADAMIRNVAWDFNISLQLPLEAWQLEGGSMSKERIFEAYQRNVGKWETSMRRKAQAFWKKMKEMLEFFGGEAQGFQVDAPSEEVAEIEGFNCVVKNFKADRNHHERMDTIRAGLRLYRQNAQKYLPILLSYQTPIILDFTANLSAGGEYKEGKVVIYATSAENPNRVAHFVAHEMGHHLYQALGDDSTNSWYRTVRGDYEPLDLQAVLDNWPGDAWAFQFSQVMGQKDPIMALQVEALSNDRSYSELQTKEDFQKLLDSGERTVAVPKTPITGYANKNPQEAFCEAIGMMVGYGPRAVHERVRHWLDWVLPETSKRASKTASEFCALSNVNTLLREFQAKRFTAKQAAPVRVPDETPLAERLWDGLTTVLQKTPKERRGEPIARMVRHTVTPNQFSSELFPILTEKLDIPSGMISGWSGSVPVYVVVSNEGWHSQHIFDGGMLSSSKATGPEALILTLQGSMSVNRMLDILESRTTTTTGMHEFSWLRSVLKHETTHITQHTRENTVSPKDGPDAYYNDPAEFEAYLQQILHEVDDSAMMSDPEFVRMWFAGKDNTEMLQNILESNSKSWKAVKKHLNEANKREVYKEVAKLFDARGVFTKGSRLLKRISSVDPMSIVRKLMHILPAGTPLPEIKVVNSPAQRWFGRCTWSIKGGKAPETSLIELQKRITGDEETLTRVIAHELCHHAQYFEEWKQAQAKGISLEGFAFYMKLMAEHGSSFNEWANKFNAVYGQGYVSHTTDAAMVIEETAAKPVYVLLWKQKNGKVYWCISARPSAKQKEYIKKYLTSEHDECRLTTSKDTLILSGAPIGNGWSVPNSPEKEAKLLALWNEGPEAKVASHTYAPKRQWKDYTKVAAKTARYLTIDELRARAREIEQRTDLVKEACEPKRVEGQGRVFRRIAAPLGDAAWQHILSRFPKEFQAEVLAERSGKSLEDIQELQNWRLTSRAPVVIPLNAAFIQQQCEAMHLPAEVVQRINEMWGLGLRPSGQVYDPNPERYFRYAQMPAATANPSIMLGPDIVWGVGRFVAACLRGDRSLRVWKLRQGKSASFLTKDDIKARAREVEERTGKSSRQLLEEMYARQDEHFPGFVKEASTNVFYHGTNAEGDFETLKPSVTGILWLTDDLHAAASYAMKHYHKGPATLWKVTLREGAKLVALWDLSDPVVRTIKEQASTERRMTIGFGISDENWVRQAADFGMLEAFPWIVRQLRANKVDGVWVHDLHAGRKHLSLALINRSAIVAQEKDALRPEAVHA